MRLAARILKSLSTFLAATGSAYGPDGHHTIGPTADRLTPGTSAEHRRHALLGPLSLERAAVWADSQRAQVTSAQVRRLWPIPRARRP